MKTSNFFVKGCAALLVLLAAGALSCPGPGPDAGRHGHHQYVDGVVYRRQQQHVHIAHCIGERHGRLHRRHHHGWCSVGDTGVAEYHRHDVVYVYQLG